MFSLIKIVSCFIPIKSWRKKFRSLLKQQQKYKLTIKKINKKLSKGEKIKVGFFVIFDSVFPAENIFKDMLNEELFDPYIIAIPDISRGEENQWHNLQKTFATLSHKYPNVINSYNEEKNEFEDFSTKADIFFFANPYDQMTHDFYRVDYISQNALTVHIPYAYSGQFKYTTKVFGSKEYNLFWKIYTENERTNKLVKSFQSKMVDNLEIVGYPKMDNINQLDTKKSEKPLIIISPHHTIRNIKGFLNISNFLRLADFYLRLPQKYPNIDFIFRPHPLLLVQLRMQDLWGKEKTDSYINKMKNYPNVEFQDGGEYLSSFQKSWGIINDCGSFLPEYFYFNKPQCFVLESEEKTEEQFTSIGKNILKYVYKAYTEKNIIDFIEQTILKQEDPMAAKRENFAKNEIMINYPNATKTIIESIKKAINRI